MNTIELNSWDDIMTRLQKMQEMQRTHNQLIQDFKTLYEITQENLENPKQVKPVIRSCIKELFSMIEADLYLINQHNPYDGYDDFEYFNEKFKRTYRHHAECFKKEEKRLAYQSRSYKRMLRMVAKRNEVTHPKSRHSIAVTLEDLKEVQIVFTEYETYINQLMTDVGYCIQLNNAESFRK